MIVSYWLLIAMLGQGLILIETKTNPPVIPQELGYEMGKYSVISSTFRYSSDEKLPR